ncbi:EamA family transporter [Kerstersia sp.]|uniref:EamA family transporter n=1 Tax=Kerstersia sp. TaxID=1930783 RepID=UPI003F905FA9
MFPLILAIGSSVAVTLLLKQSARRGCDHATMIAVNYLLATLLCLIWLPPSLSGWQNMHTPWWVLLALGLVLPAGFLVMGSAVKHAGVVRSDAAQRLSVCLPLLAAFLFFGQTLTPAILAGIGLAMAALLLLMQGPPQAASAAALPASRRSRALLLAVWFAYGSVDTLFKQVARHQDHFATVLLICFVLAAIVMALFLWQRGQRLAPRDLAWGVALGLLNFSNIVFYLRAHRAYPDNPALVFTAMNIGVIAAGALAGACLFKERPGLRGWAGVGLAMGAIVALWPR